VQANRRDANPVTVLPHGRIVHLSGLHLQGMTRFSRHSRFLICIGENSHASARTDDDQSQDSLTDRGDRDARHGGTVIGCRLQLCTHSDDDSNRPGYRRAVSDGHVGGFGEGKVS
jgi:hypothetical protein